METTSQASLYLWSNSEPLRRVVQKYLENLSLKVETKEKKETDYRVLLISLSQHEDPNSLVLDTLDSLKNYPGKTCLVIAGDSQTDQQLPTQIRSLTDSYLKNKQLNIRLIPTFDLYDADSNNPLAISRMAPPNGEGLKRPPSVPPVRTSTTPPLSPISAN